MTGLIVIRYAISSTAGPLDELVPTSILVRLSFCFLAYLFWGSFAIVVSVYWRGRWLTGL